MAEANINNNTTSTNSGLTKSGYLIIIGGQSNGVDTFTMSGNINAGLQTTQIDCYTYFKTVTTIADNGSWVQMNPGVNTQNGVPQTGEFSIGLIIADRLKNTYGKSAYIVPTAVGGTWIANDVVPSWNSTHSGEYYDTMLKECFRRAQVKLGGATPTPVLLWIHGEYDSDTLAHGTAYNANLTALINKFRTDTGYPDMKVVITTVRSDLVGIGTLGLTQVRQAQVDISTSLSNVYLYNTDVATSPYSSDGTHYAPITPSFAGTQSATNIGIALADLISTF